MPSECWCFFSTEEHDGQLLVRAKSPSGGRGSCRAENHLGRARLLPSRSQLSLFSCRCSPTTVARAFLTPRTKTVAWALARASCAPPPQKHRVFPPKEVRLSLPFDFCPSRHSCPAAFGPHKAAKRRTLARLSSIPWADKHPANGSLGIVTELLLGGSSMGFSPCRPPRSIPP